MQVIALITVTAWITLGLVELIRHLRRRRKYQPTYLGPLQQESLRLLHLGLNPPLRWYGLAQAQRRRKSAMHLRLRHLLLHPPVQRWPAVYSGYLAPYNLPIVSFQWMGETRIYDKELT